MSPNSESLTIDNQNAGSQHNQGAVASHNEQAVEQMFEQALERYRTKQYASPKSLKVWLDMVHYRFEPHFITTPEMKGHVVKIQLRLNERGFVEQMATVSSSGNRALEQLARHALNQAQPFAVNGLSESDKRRAQHSVLTFVAKP